MNSDYNNNNRFNDSNDLSVDYNNINQALPNEYMYILNEKSFLDEMNEKDCFNFINEKDNSHEKTVYITSNLNNIFQKKNENKEKDCPKLLILDEIKELIKKFPENDDIIKNLCYNDEIKEAENLLQLTKKKRERPSNDIYDEIDEKDYDLEKDKNKKRGRKTNKIKNRGVHTKFSDDNIIKSIKSKLFKYSLDFLNNMIGEKKNYQLKPLDYKYTNKLKREQDLYFLDMSLHYLFSKEITSKVKSKEKDHNKKSIETILENEKDPSIQFAFHMTFNEWLDLFLFKKDIKDIANNYIYDDYTIIDFKKIDNNLIKVDDLLNKMLKSKEADQSFTLFILYLYNYKRWFHNKKGRNRGKNSYSI